MTTLTSLIRPAAAPAAPSFTVASRLPALRGLVVFLVSAVIAAGFVFDVAGGARPQPKTQAVQQAVYLT